MVVKSVSILGSLVVLSLLSWSADTHRSAIAGTDPFYSSVPTAYMDDPRRDEWQKPDQVMQQLHIGPGSVVADIGAGTGYFSLRFARRAGAKGLVFAVDVEPEMLVRIRERSQRLGLVNIKTVLAAPDDPLLPVGAVDVVFICDTYLFLDNRVDYLSRVAKSLTRGGRVAIVSFNERALVPGAPPPHRQIPREVTVREAAQAGLQLEAEHHFLPYQDFLIFIKKEITS